MKKELFWATVWIIAVTLTIASLADAADFTVDRRSLLHVGASASIAATANTLASEYDIHQRKRNLVAGFISGGVGWYKEFAVDDHHDLGDITFNLVGIVGGIWGSEKYLIIPVENGLAVAGVF